LNERVALGRAIGTARRRKEPYPGNLLRLLSPGRVRRKREAESENDGEPDQAHAAGV